MKETFAKRLKSARLLAGLSQDKLVHKMDGVVSKNAISKYENGLMQPDSKVLIALARVLNVKTDYFFRPFNASIENIEYRKKSKLSSKTREAINAQVVDMVERYLEVEQFLNTQSIFQNPLVDLIIKDQQDVEHAAEKLLQTWNLGFNALPNVIELLEEKEIKVIEIDTSLDFDGFSGWADQQFPVIVINKNYNVERKRLTALHELAHLLLHFSADLDQKMIEKMCFQFAGAILIPRETLQMELGVKRNRISTKELIYIKENYGLSIQAIMHRAKELGIISEQYYKRFRIYIRNNREENGLGEYKGIEASKRFKQLIYRAASEEIISMSKAANLSNQKLAGFRKEFIAL